jgi:hypothetical protein
MAGLVGNVDTAQAHAQQTDDIVTGINDYDEDGWLSALSNLPVGFLGQGFNAVPPHPVSLQPKPYPATGDSRCHFDTEEQLTLEDDALCWQRGQLVNGLTKGGQIDSLTPLDAAAGICPSRHPRAPPPERSSGGGELQAAQSGIGAVCQWGREAGGPAAMRGDPPAAPAPHTTSGRKRGPSPAQQVKCLEVELAARQETCRRELLRNLWLRERATMLQLVGHGEGGMARLVWASVSPIARTEPARILWVPAWQSAWLLPSQACRLWLPLSLAAT